MQQFNNKIKHTFYEKYKEIVVSLTNPISRSEFQNSGKITPKEFVEAGDILVQKFPAWEWKSGNSDILPSLPNNKKYLKLSGVISKNRPSFSNTITSSEYDDWEITDIINENNDNNNNETNNETNNENDDNTDDDDDFSFVTQKRNTLVRMYDLTVIYDQYYATPRLYLIGYNCDGVLLSGIEMMDDVYSTNREKTVTIEIHPFLKVSCLSIHPCRHAETIKRMLDRIEERIMNESNDNKFYFPANMCLFIFLKFMSSIIPTIEYDISIGIDF